MKFKQFITESYRENAELSDFPEDLQKLIKRLPIGDPKIIELSSTSAGVSINYGMLFHNDLKRIMKDAEKYQPLVSVTNGKMMLVFTLNV